MVQLRLARLSILAVLPLLLHTVAAAALRAPLPINQPQHSLEAVDLPSASDFTMTPRIILPLYVYPTSGAWDPLYTAISQNPDAAFTIIINPNSGPGKGKAPNSDYTKAINQLRATAGPNQVVELVGYVPTGYGKRSKDKIKADVRTYSNWPDAVRPDGIFFDETNTQKKYLDKYTEYTTYAKSLTWGSNQYGINARNALTILNPGIWPISSGFWAIPADTLVVFEDKLSNFNYTDYVQKSLLMADPFKRSYIFYNADPSNLVTKDGKTFTDLDALVNASTNGLFSRGGLFVTDLDIQTTDVYAQFSDIWQQFVQAVDHVSSWFLLP